jgi:tetratricopeptide (TPR) repeat protein
MKYLNIAMVVICVTSSATIYASYAVADPAVDALNENRLNEARTLFLQQLPTTETKSITLTFLGKVELYAGNYDKAIDNLQQSLEAAPDTALNYLLLGKSYCNKAQTSTIFSALGLAKQ